MKTALERLHARQEKAASLRADMTRLFDYGTRLRCADPPKGTRAQALRYQSQQIEKLAALSVESGGTADGWPDPGDPFAYGDQIAGLRVDLGELSRQDAPYPVPLPVGCTLLPQANFDPFEHGRYYSGKLITGEQFAADADA